MSNLVPITVAYGVLDQGIEIVKTENLRTFDDKPGYTLAQGQ